MYHSGVDINCYRCKPYNQHLQTVDGENAKDAHTCVTVLDRGQYEGLPCTKISATILTGRTHQIRVHLSYMGHPIVGDWLYSNRTDYKPFRTMLHAYRLELCAGNEVLKCCSPDPFLNDPRWKSML
ncbi:hypothetical protein GJ496_003949 [Pomphorhynchus laevis]|nr:hypothetical protein GJ496_003949 [Pomphorhynchus laevis]